MRTMCECLTDEDGGRYLCPLCSDMAAENERVIGWMEREMKSIECRELPGGGAEWKVVDRRGYVTRTEGLDMYSTILAASATPAVFHPQRKLPF